MIESPNDTVEAACEAGVCTITLNRPAALNALDRDMAAALAAVTRAAAADEAVRAVVVRGAGGTFMAGGDLKAFKAWLADMADAAERRERFGRFVHEVHPTILALRGMPKPVLASVAGAVAGFGMSLMLACDLALAADDAVLTLAYSQIAVSPDGGSTHALPRTVGLKRAFEIAYLGGRLDAAQAAALGLVNRVVPAAALDDETRALARRLAAGPTRAYAHTKALLNAAPTRPLEDQLAAEAAAFADCASTADFEEGLAAFLDKRGPRFTGR